MLHKEKVPRKGVGCGSEVGEEKRDPVSMTSFAPSVWGIEGSTVDEKLAPTLDK